MSVGDKAGLEEPSRAFMSSLPGGRPDILTWDFSSLTQFTQMSKQKKGIPMGTSEALGADDIL